jgi:glycyl-tRNA synthetase
LPTGSADFLLELGTEELPPDEVTSAVAQLQSLFEDLLGQCRLAHTSIKAMGTPRRLTVVVSALAAEQETVEEERRGPPKSRAFDEAGNPTKAVLGFCRTCGAELSAVRFVPDAKVCFTHACSAF